MPRASTKNKEEKSTDLIAAEAAGKEALRMYCRYRQGRATEISNKTGILLSVLSKMANKSNHINLEAAVLIEAATEGELRADVLCPSRADVLAKLLALRSGEKAA